MEALRSPRSLLLLTFLLAVQFCYPLAAVNQRDTVVVGISGLGVKDPESKPGLPIDLDLAPPVRLMVVATGNAFLPDPIDPTPHEVGAVSALPTTGVYPSAP